MASLNNQTHDHLIYDLVKKIVASKPLSGRLEQIKGIFILFFSEMVFCGVGGDGRLSTMALLLPGVTPDASYLASVIRCRANIG